MSRRRSAGELPESIAQSLSALKLRLQTIAHAEDRPATRAQLSDAVALVDDLIAQTWAHSTAPLAPIPDDLGLVPTLVRYCEQSSRALPISVVEEGERHPVPARLERSLFAAVKQLVANAVTHSGARQALVAVHWRRGGVRIVVADDGHGFDVHSVLRGRRRRGLAELRQRAGCLGGALLLESAPETGTRAILDIPFRAA